MLSRPEHCLAEAMPYSGDHAWKPTMFTLPSWSFTLTILSGVALFFPLYAWFPSCSLQLISSLKTDTGRPCKYPASHKISPRVSVHQWPCLIQSSPWFQNGGILPLAPLPTYQLGFWHSSLPFLYLFITCYWSSLGIGSQFLLPPENPHYNTLLYLSILVFRESRIWLVWAFSGWHMSLWLVRCILGTLPDFLPQQPVLSSSCTHPAIAWSQPALQVVRCHELGFKCFAKLLNKNYRAISPSFNFLLPTSNYFLQLILFALNYLITLLLDFSQAPIFPDPYMVNSLNTVTLIVNVSINMKM
jgi:hypothetical protein